MKKHIKRYLDLSGSILGLQLSLANQEHELVLIKRKKKDNAELSEKDPIMQDIINEIKRKTELILIKREMMEKLRKERNKYLTY